jgi:hypothetical protein
LLSVSLQPQSGHVSPAAIATSSASSCGVFVVVIVTLQVIGTAHRRDTRIIGGFPDAKLTAAVREHWDLP